jgi:hypothetical protein
VDWLHRIRRAPPQDEQPREPDRRTSPPVERAAPGIAALFAGLDPSRTYSVLDLGAAAESHLRLYGTYARQIRFADLLERPSRGADWAGAVHGIPPNPHQPYDLVLAWNLLDRLGPETRHLLIERLDGLTAHGARLYAAVDASGASETRPLRFKLLGVDRVRQEVAGPPEAAPPQLLPAQVERLLAPFEVVRAFTLRLGLREYVAVKGGEAAYHPHLPKT